MQDITFIVNDTHNISIIHVDFLPEHAAFYEKCGFAVGLGGVIGA